MIMYIVYVLKNSETKEIYIGKTNNLKRRIDEHNKASQKSSTHRLSGLWIIVYAEAYRDKRDADERELRLKDHGRSKQEMFRRSKYSLET